MMKLSEAMTSIFRPAPARVAIEAHKAADKLTEQAAKLETLATPFQAMVSGMKGTAPCRPRKKKPS